MAGFPSPFGGSDEADGGPSGATVDDVDAFVPEHLPEPGPFLGDHDVLVGRNHVAVHRVTREIFEARGVYDATFGYNLADLNLDARHPDAGYRYAREADDPSVLRAAFTPTTAFCPQSDALAKGSFRAWNGLAARHGFDLVRVRVAPMHQAAATINETLAWLEERYRETGEVDHRVPAEVGDGGGGGAAPRGGATDRGPDAPF